MSARIDGRIGEPVFLAGRLTNSLLPNRFKETKKMEPLTTLHLTADADPTVLNRVAGVLCTLSLLPVGLSAVRGPDDTLSVTIQLVGISERSIDLLQRNLMRMPQFVALKLECLAARIAC